MTRKELHASDAMHAMQAASKAHEHLDNAHRAFKRPEVMDVNQGYQTLSDLHAAERALIECLSWIQKIHLREQG